MGMPTIPSEEGTSTDEAGTETPVATRVPKKGTVSRREMVTKLEECAKVAEAKINNERKGISEHADKESDEKTITLGMATLNLMCNSTVHTLVTDIAGVPTVEPCEVQQEGTSESEMMSSSVLGAGSWIQEPENNATSQANGNVLNLASIDRPPPILTGLFGEDWQSTLRACPGGPTESSSTPSNGPGGGTSQSDLPGNAGSPTNCHGRSQKRLSEEGGGSGEGDDPDLPKKAKFEKRLACPIWRKDPHYYQTSHLHKSKYTNCAAGMGFDGISRLKEHIFRVHVLPLACNRCGLEFEKQKDLDDHTLKIETNGCQVRKLPPPKGISPHIQQELKGRSKHGKKPSQEEQWLQIYHSLFDCDPCPTSGAYREDTESPLSSFQNADGFSSVSELPQILDERLDDHLSQLIPDPVSREQTKRNIITDVIADMKQPLPNFPATPSFGESNKTRHRTSGASWTDSGYGSICGNPECMGNCYFCNQLATHSHRRSSDADFQILPPSFGDTEAGYFNPATLVNRGNRGPMSSLHSTEDNYDIFEYPFPIYSPGNHSFDGCPP